MTWKVVPLSPGQLLDVCKEDVLEGGLYRSCDTYRGGGGYDLFPDVCERAFGKALHHQFVVQLQACVLDCPYCYVTRAGVWGVDTKRTTEELVEAFVASKQEIFHLMGGAPAIYLKQWPDLIERLFKVSPDAVFHSDLMLVEGSYRIDDLRGCRHDRAIYAIDVKGVTDKAWEENTRKKPQWSLFWSNWLKVQEAGLQTYATFTNVSPSDAREFMSEAYRRGIHTTEHYTIDLINYAATAHVDSQPWGLLKTTTEASDFIEALKFSAREEPTDRDAE